jgi:hypothetical protein
MAPHRNPPLPNQQQQPKTAGANSKLDKTWGQGHVKLTYSVAGGKGVAAAELIIQG